MTELVRLPHSLRPVLRPDGVVQLGSPPGRSVEVPGLSHPEYAYLCSLLAPASERSDRAALEDAGLEPDQRARLVARLRELDAVVDVSDPPRARAMCGRRRDRLRQAVQSLQAAGGTGGWATVEARDRATVVVDTGPPWAGTESVGEVARGLVERLTDGGVGQVLGPDRAARWWHLLGDHGSPCAADLVVPVLPARTDAIGLRRLVGARIPHLPVLVTPGWVGIGPAVRPGRACLECVARHEMRPEELAAEYLDRSTEAPRPDPRPPVGRAPADLVDWAISWGSRTVLWLLDGAGEPEEGPARVSALAHSPVPAVQRFGVHPECWCTGVAPAP
ncbi:hypothetical protein [Kytococcus sp. Marseille-QA3725]